MKRASWWAMGVLVLAGCASTAPRSDRDVRGEDAEVAVDGDDADVAVDGDDADVAMDGDAPPGDREPSPDREVGADDAAPDAARDASLDATPDRPVDASLDAAPDRPDAVADAIWPWLVQMGCRRAGFYSVDALDNGNARSAREVHPEWQNLRVGDVIPATPDGADGFEVLRVDAPRALVLGGLFDVGSERQLPFHDPRPPSWWHVTWAFALEALDAGHTRLRVRARASFSPDERAHAAWIGPAHHFMQAAQLRHLAARVEGRLARDDWRDALEGAGGAALMALGWATPFLRERRNHWGLDAERAAEPRPGDELIPRPRWGWTHAVEVDAPAAAVWPWVAQMGADRAGFYSYQSLENLAGCKLRNAEVLHPAWAHREGDDFILHPKQPPMKVVSLEPGRHLLAYGAPDEAARAAGKPWAAVTWLFAVEPLGDARCRFVSRYRCDYSDDLAMRLAMGPALIEPVGFAMDRRMLLAVKARVEAAR